MKLKSVLFGALLALGITVAQAQTVLVSNGTGFVIQRLGLAAAGTSQFTDLLGEEVLNPGEGLNIEISGDSNGWDLLAQDDEGTDVSWNNLDLTGVSKITLNADATADVE